METSGRPFYTGEQVPGNCPFPVPQNAAGAPFRDNGTDMAAGICAQGNAAVPARTGGSADASGSGKEAGPERTLPAYLLWKLWASPMCGAPSHDVCLWAVSPRRVTSSPSPQVGRGQQRDVSNGDARCLEWKGRSKSLAPDGAEIMGDRAPFWAGKECASEQLTFWQLRWDIQRNVRIFSTT